MSTTIDRAARQEARAISKGSMPHKDTLSKVAFYGIVARALKLEALPERLMLSYPTHASFIGLEQQLKIALVRSAHDGYSELSDSERHLANTSFEAHIPETRKHSRGLSTATYDRIRGGCGTAAAIEVTTLRTIAKKQVSGETVSLAGLYASDRVPLRIAMMHLGDLLETKIDNRAGAPDNYGLWRGKHEVAPGYVFLDSDVCLDPDEGLKLLNTGEGTASDMHRRDYGPHIGCPAMLVVGYIKKIHLLAANAALEAGLIEVS